MDDKKLLFIVNPRAGKTKSLAPLFDAAAIYSEAGYLVSVRKTTHRGEATELAESLGPEFDVRVDLRRLEAAVIEFRRVFVHALPAGVIQLLQR